MPSERLRPNWPRLVTDPYETRAVEYKQSSPWPDILHGVARTALALANLRDGGWIVIGVRQGQGGRLIADGMTDEHLESYNVDTVHGQLASFAVPALSLRAELLEHERKRFFVIEVDQFRDVPVIAAKGSPDNTRNGVRKGRIYARPLGVASTAVADAEDLREILDLAIQIGVSRFVAVLQRSGGILVHEHRSARHSYAEERGGF